MARGLLSPVHMKRAASCLFAFLLLGSTGCNFYFADDDDECDDWGGSPYPVGEYQLRNPDTGLCEYYSDYYWDCSDPCSPCPGAAESDAIAMPSWGYCESYCESLDETSCLVTSGCRAAYLNSCAGADCASDTKTFYACWSTDQTGPIQGGGCEGLSAWDCSRHDDCSAVHETNGCFAGAPAEEDEARVCEELGYFQQCIDEPVMCDEFNTDVCPEGTHCDRGECV